MNIKIIFLGAEIRKMNNTEVILESFSLKQELFQNNSDELCREIYAAFCANRTDIIPTIKKTFNTNSSLKKIINSSYVHPNGFYKIPLVEFDQFGPKIRLHIWIPSLLAPKDIYSNIHTHHWGFESIVIIGQIRHITFSEKTGSSYVKYQLDRQPNHGHTLHKHGVCDLSKLNEQQFTAGSSYSLNATDIHQLSPSSQFQVTATLIHQYRHTERLNHVYLPIYENEVVFNHTPNRLSEDDIYQLFRKLNSVNA